MVSLYDSSNTNRPPGETILSDLEVQTYQIIVDSLFQKLGDAHNASIEYTFGNDDAIDGDTQLKYVCINDLNGKKDAFISYKDIRRRKSDNRVGSNALAFQVHISETDNGDMRISHYPIFPSPDIYRSRGDTDEARGKAGYTEVTISSAQSGLRTSNVNVKDGVEDVVYKRNISAALEATRLACQAQQGKVLLRQQNKEINASPDDVTALVLQAPPHMPHPATGNYSAAVYSTPDKYSQKPQVSAPSPIQPHAEQENEAIQKFNVSGEEADLLRSGMQKFLGSIHLKQAKDDILTIRNLSPITLSSVLTEQMIKRLVINKISIRNPAGIQSNRNTILIEYTKKGIRYELHIEELRDGDPDGMSYSIRSMSHEKQGSKLEIKIKTPELYSNTNTIILNAKKEMNGADRKRLFDNSIDAMSIASIFTRSKYK